MLLAGVVLEAAKIAVVHRQLMPFLRSPRTPTAVPGRTGSGRTFALWKQVYDRKNGWTSSYCGCKLFANIVQPKENKA
jgi:hypothetical protein